MFQETDIPKPPVNLVGSATQAIQYMRRPDRTIVFVYATWCGHCKTMYPFWNTVCAKRPGTSLIAVESEIAKQIESGGSAPAKWNVEGFPTIVETRGGTVVDTFSGGGNALGAWVDGKLGPALIQKRPMVAVRPRVLKSVHQRIPTPGHRAKRLTRVRRRHTVRGKKTRRKKTLRKKTRRKKTRGKKTRGKKTRGKKTRGKKARH